MKSLVKFPITWITFGGFFDPARLRKQIADLTEQSLSPDLWNNPDDVRAIMQKKSAAERDLQTIVEMDAEFENLRELYAIAPDDADVIAEI